MTKFLIVLLMLTWIGFGFNLSKLWDLQIENEKLKELPPEISTLSYSLKHKKTEWGYAIECWKLTEPPQLLVEQHVMR